MSWSSPLRVLGVCGLWLAVLTGCGGTPEVAGNGKGTDGGSATGGTGATSGSGGGIVIDTGGADDSPGGAGNDVPPVYVCGNSKLEPGEFCDDGNTDDNDGCSGDCKDVNLDFDCSVVGEKCVKVVICGNGVLEGSEVCDDGNTMATDGCSADCGTLEDGWVCVRPGKPCVAVSVCGNGVRERGEACDDGQTPPAAGDGCDDQCQIEQDYYCPNPGMACVKQVCGDGVRTPNEQCDDGKMPPADGDGCSKTCVVEAGWHCNSMGCKPECGDGLRRGTEGCDDGNATGGDGCSSACVVEPFYSCNQAEPSVCGSSIACGNGKVEPGEVCDPPGTDGCLAGCKSFKPDTSNPAMCGNNLIEDTETCDPPDVGNGCTAACKVENGFTCPQAGVCFKNPFCGDNIVQAAQAEGCDPPNVGNGCSAACKVEGGWTCVGLGPSTCIKPVCGNSVVDPGEQCDDGTNNATQDGCSGCVIGTGWSCPTPGAACIPKCGDGVKVGTEQCDDGPANRASGDGCNAGCKIEVGFSCPTVGAKCVASVCGDKTIDAGEGCDDGGLCFGGTNNGTACTKDSNCTGGGTCKTVAGDGCGPTCQPEPTVTVGPSPTVNVFCGDGLKTGTEVCDDGNTTDGDGCQGDCKSVTPGWTCPSKLTLPPTLQMQVTYRDFKANGAPTGGHPHFENVNEDNKGIAGQPCTAATQATCGRLDNQGKPVTAGGFSSIPGNGASTSVLRYATWYRDTNTLGFDVAAIKDSLTLTQIGGVNSETYEYASAAHFPIDGRGLGNTCGTEVSPACCNAGGVCVGHNFSFTTELRYFFQYQGGETLTFRGDDDVWVFINGRLAVDVGGVHCAEAGRVTLGDEDSSCSVHGADYDGNSCALTGNPPACGLVGAELTGTTDNRFGLTKGGVYEIALFHAERHTSASNFRLTLAGFLAPHSSCDTTCGDGIRAGDEFCDDGASNSDTASGACNTSCTARTYCGDGIRQSMAGPLLAEACDNGTNTDVYKTAQSPANVCAPGCKVPASCGDGVLQAGYEQCDKGAQNDDASYGKTSCTTACKLGGYCGDGVPQTGNGEVCDLGANNGKTYGNNSCGYDCQPGPRCGDHIRNGGEVCDDGVDNGTVTSHCDTDCTIKPYCGDGIKAVGEECDYGQFASTEYGGCTDMCMFGPRCGDGGPGDTPDPEEECDRGTAANTGGYDGCTNKCALGPRCGDGVKQAAQGEACDNGFNADDYDDPKTAAAECGPGCTPPPFCGDMVVQSAHELCDAGKDNNDNTYNGCTTLCDFGAYCGDSHIDSPDEACDDGPDNVSYAANKGGCSYDCQPAPYCGDAERNGPEQCDLGADKNTGDYGTCNADCTFGPRCGDGKKDASEECDDGPTGSQKCTLNCKKRDIVQ
jgi:fibro-slime domain-containing protein